LLPYLSGCNARQHTVLQRTPDKNCGKGEEQKQPAAEASWGANAETLQTSAMTLCYSVAEYCALVWSQSSNTELVDVQLNSTMCLISSTLSFTPLSWLPVLANIEPPALRRKAATDKLVEKIIARDNWPIYSNITNPPHACLPSRKPLRQDLVCVDIRSQWKEIAGQINADMQHNRANGDTSTKIGTMTP